MSVVPRQTEQTVASHRGIDTWDDLAILSAFADGQQRALDAVRNALPAISSAAQLIAKKLSAGGRLIYAGAGTSIRVGVQDGAELPATFGLAEDRIAYCIAGGRAAMFDTLADAEDNQTAARADVEAACCGAADALIAIAASGSTPYTVAAAHHARVRGAATIAIVNNAGSPLGEACDQEILLASGPEVIGGSTRMGAGTAQKAALNFLSTLVNIRLGAVHDGMMVNLKADNAKLKLRARSIVAAISGASDGRAASALEACDGHVKPAVLLCSGAKSYPDAQHLLTLTQGNLRLALERLRSA